jgi:hypothetical protein
MGWYYGSVVSTTVQKVACGSAFTLYLPLRSLYNTVLHNHTITNPAVPAPWCRPPPFCCRPLCDWWPPR